MTGGTLFQETTIYKVVPPPPWCLLVYNPNNFRYNPHEPKRYSTYKPTER